METTENTQAKEAFVTGSQFQNLHREEAWLISLTKATAFGTKASVDLRFCWQDFLSVLNLFNYWSRDSDPIGPATCGLASSISWKSCMFCDRNLCHFSFLGTSKSTCQKSCVSYFCTKMVEAAFCHGDSHGEPGGVLCVTRRSFWCLSMMLLNCVTPVLVLPYACKYHYICQRTVEGRTGPSVRSGNLQSDIHCLLHFCPTPEPFG